MAFYYRPRDPQFDPIDQPMRTSSVWLINVAPFFFAAIVVIVLIAMFLPSSTPTRLGDTTNAGPSVKTINPSSSPSTVPTEPTPKPITEPRPTQDPIR